MKRAIRGKRMKYLVHVLGYDDIYCGGIEEFDTKKAAIESIKEICKRNTGSHHDNVCALFYGRQLKIERVPFSSRCEEEEK